MPRFTNALDLLDAADHERIEHERQHSLWNPEVEMNTLFTAQSGDDLQRSMDRVIKRAGSTMRSANQLMDAVQRLKQLDQLDHSTKTGWSVVRWRPSRYPVLIATTLAVTLAGALTLWILTL